MKKSTLTFLLILITVAGAIAQSIDSSFTTNGYLPYGGPLSNNKQNNHIGNNLVRQPDGKIVVAEDFSYVTTDFTLNTYRYNTDGTPDITFGTNGVSSIFCGLETNNRDLVLQPDGKIVVVGATKYCILGVCGALQFIMMRLNTDGSLDTTFGNGGKLITTDVFGTTGLFAQPYRVKIQPDGKFVIGGRGPGGYSFVARLNSNGSNDMTFAINGIYTDTANYLTFRDLVVNSTGDILMLLVKYNSSIGGVSDTNNLNDNYVLKVTSTGVPDNTFATGGRLVFSVSNNDDPISIALRSDQSIVIVGDEQYNNTENYNWNGTGTNGYGYTNKGYVAFVNTNGTMATHIPGGHKSFRIPADSATFFKKIIVLNDNRLFISGRVIRQVSSGNYQEKALLTQIDYNGNYLTDFNTNGYWVFDCGITGLTGWDGRQCGFNDIDVTPSHEAYATGYRNPVGGSTGTCLFLMKLKDVPFGTTTTGIPDKHYSSISLLYPNPVLELFSIASDDYSTYTICNTEGKVISRGNLIKGRNDILLPRSLASGIYFIRDEKTNDVVKFIKD